MKIAVEDASIQYLDRLYEIEMECFKNEAFTKQQIAQLITAYNSLGLVAKENSTIVGFIIAMVNIERKSLTGHILTIDVLPAHRRKGIAQELLQEIEKMFSEKGVEKCYLEVREDNIAALNLYQKLRYKKIAKLRKYYGKANGIYLRKDLT